MTEAVQKTLTERVQQAWSVILGKAETPKPDTLGVADATKIAAMLGEWQQLFAMDSDRMSRYADFELMLRGYIAKMVKQVVESATTFEGSSGPNDDELSENRCFKIQIQGYGTEAPRQVIKQVVRDTQMRRKVRAWLKTVIVYGDGFLEPLFDEYNNIVDVFSHRPHEMIVQRDDKGRLLTGVDDKGLPLAYRQVTSTGEVKGAWFPWEIVHVRYSPVDHMAYSEESFLDDYRTAWRRVDYIESAMVIGRVVRAYVRYVHQLDMSGKSTQEAQKGLKDYIRAFTMKVTPSGSMVKTAPQVDSDLFITKSWRTGPDGKLYESLNDVKAIDPNGAAFSADADVRHFQRQYFDLVPAENLGMNDQQVQDLTGIDVAYSNFIKNHIQQSILEDQIIRRLLDMALLVKGYRNVPYSIIFPSTIGSQSWRLADAQFRLSLAARSHLEMGTSDRVFWMKRLFGLSDEQAKAVVDAGMKELAANPLNKADRSAQQAVGNQSSSLDRAIDKVVEEIIQNPPESA